MPYELKPRLDETILADIALQVSRKAEPFRFAVTNQAHYVPVTKFVVSGDPRYFEPLPNEQINTVQVRRMRPYGFWLLAAVMLAVGVGLLALIVSWLAHGTEFRAQELGWALALIVGGVLLPVVAKGRYCLQVLAGRRRFQWSPPLVVDGASKRQIAATLDSILEASRRVGVATEDARLMEKIGKAA